MPVSAFGKVVLANYIEPPGSDRGSIVGVARLEILRASAPGLTVFYGWLYAYYLRGSAAAGYKFSLASRRAMTDGGALILLPALALPPVVGETISGYQLVAHWDIGGIPYEFSI